MHNALDIGSGPAVRCLNVHSYSCIQLYSRTVHDRRVYDRSASTAGCTSTVRGPRGEGVTFYLGFFILAFLIRNLQLVARGSAQLLNLVQL
jgi:hypothetical protein